MAKLLSNTRIFGTGTVDTQLFVNGNNSAHSTNTGALQVSGGIGVGGGGFFGGTVTATNFVGVITGSATQANNLNGGTAGQLVYQSAPNATAFAGPGTAGQLLVSSGTNPPVYFTTSSIQVGFSANLLGGETNQFAYQTAPGVTAFATTGSMYVGRAAVADSVASSNTVQTVQQTANNSYYLTLVDSNNLVATSEFIYTTSSFVVNAATGYVGLGTVTPTERLELSAPANAARIKLTNSTAGKSSIMGHDATGFYWQPTNNADLFELKNAAGTGLLAFNPASGSVGIGTSSPDRKLHVAGTTGDTRIRVSADDGTNMRGFEITAGTVFKGGLFYRTTEGNVLQIWGPTDSSSAINIDSNNTVKINTATSVHSTATGALQVSGGIGVGGGGFFGGVVTATTFVGTLNGSISSTRFNPRVVSSASAASLTPDISVADQYAFTALAVALAINAPIGSPVDGNRLLIRLLDNGTSRSLTWDPTYTAIGVTLPNATTINKTTYVGCIYNANNLRWDVVAVTTQA